MTAHRRHDVVIAIALAGVLTLVWAWRDWAGLTALRLPDTDDVMRLQQIRDWLAGQGWFDLAQHRLAGGLEMHWSRLADLVPGAIIAALTPSMGAHSAQLTAVIAWPATLFATALFLIARIARRLGGGGIAGTAAVVGAIAYPATTIFVPGRIDHHGLQVALLLAALLAMLGPATAWRRAGAGLACAASLVIGLETAPLLGLAGLVMLYDWIAGEDRDGERLAGFAVGAFAGLVAGRIGFAGSGWAYPACDGFTRDAWTAAMTLAAAPVLLAGGSHFLTNTRMRAVAALTAGAAGIALVLARSPDCVSPYGRVDPLLAQLWLAHVEEAQSIVTAGPVHAIGYLGMAAAGMVATLWAWRRAEGAESRRGWGVVALLLAGSLLVAAAQLRGAYAAAMLAAPGLAAAIGHARVRGAMRLAMTWTVSAGIAYPLAGQALSHATAAPAPALGDCTSAAMLDRLAALPAGTALAPIDAGPAILAGTGDAVIAAPYHRNTAGNRAAIGYYLGRGGGADRALARSGARYVLACAGMPGIDDPRTTAMLLARGTAPGLRRVARLPDGAAIYARDPS